MLELTLKPRMSEKAYATSTLDNVYVFVVPGTATKQSIASAITSQFDVTVTKVRTVTQKGKAVRSRSKRTRGITVHRSDIKKAYVTVKAGDHISIFDAPEDTKTDVKTESKTSKLAEKLTKKDAKETKTTSKITRSSDVKKSKKAAEK